MKDLRSPCGKVGLHGLGGACIVKAPIETQNGVGWKGLYHLVPTRLLWAGTLCTRPGCSRSYPKPGLEHFHSWGIHNLPRQTFPVPHHSQSRISSQHLTQISPLFICTHPPCPSTTVPNEESLSSIPAGPPSNIGRVWKLRCVGRGT